MIGGRDLRQGLAFLARQQRLGRPAAPSPRVLAGLDLDVVEPVGRRRGTLLTVHGMSPIAQRDPRMLRLHAAFSAAGFRVVSPHLPSIAALRMHAGQIDTIEHAIAAVAEQRDLCPEGRVSLFSVSFSAGLTLVAAGRSSVADRVGAVCAVGAYGEIRSALETLLAGGEGSSYGWTIVLSNFLDAAVGPCDGAKHALRVAALDDWYARAEPELPRVLARLPAWEAALVRALRADAGVRRDTWAAILDAAPLFLTLGSVVDQLDGLVAPVTLVHGETDPVIPAHQSTQIAEALRHLGRSPRLLLTPLLGHGDATGALGALHAVPALARTLGGFLASAVTVPSERASGAVRGAVRSAGLAPSLG